MLDVHITSIHSTDNENEMPEVTSEETQDIPKSVVICGVCAQGFTNILKYKDHEVLHNKSNVACDVCSHTFPTAHEVERHIVNDHKEENPKICSVCQFSGISLGDVEKHMTDKHMFPCEQCQSTVFQTVKELTDHQTTLHAKKHTETYEYNICKTKTESLKLITIMNDHNAIKQELFIQRQA